MKRKELIINIIIAMIIMIMILYIIIIIIKYSVNQKGVGMEQGWCSSGSVHLPLLWPGFNSQTWCHMRVEFVVGPRPYSTSFSLGPWFSSLNKN